MGIRNINMPTRKKQPEQKCPTCNQRITNGKARKIESAKIVQGTVIIYKTNEMGRYNMELHTDMDLDEE